MNAVVVQRPAGEVGDRIAAIGIDRVVIHVAPDPSRIGDRMVAHCRRQHGIRGTELEGRNAARANRDVRHRVQLEKSGHPPLLLRSEQPGSDDVEVVVQQPGIGDEMYRGETDLGEAAAGNDPVEQTGVVVGDLMLLIRAAGAAKANRVAQLAIGLDEVLLDHGHRFGGEQVVAVVPEDVERGGCHGISLAEHHVVDDASRTSALAKPTADAPSAERIDEPAVPARRMGKNIGRGLTHRVVQYRRLVDRSIDGAVLHAHDVGDVRSSQRDRPHHVGGIRGEVRQRLERSIVGFVDVVDPGDDRAGVVQRRSQGGGDHRNHEGVSLAAEWLFLRTGEQGPGDRMVEQKDPRPRVRRSNAEMVFAGVEAGNEAPELAGDRIDAEPVGD